MKIAQCTEISKCCTLVVCIFLHVILYYVVIDIVNLNITANKDTCMLLV